MKQFFVVITGPTAVGKTAFVDELIEQLALPCAVVNADVGQFYTPLTIGTAKPDWRSSKTAHNFFDVLDTPTQFSVTNYREQVIQLMKKLWSENSIPFVVGGSGFYLKSLFYPPPHQWHVPAHVAEGLKKGLDLLKTEELWERLACVDFERAQALDSHDRYRIERALIIYEYTGKKPSVFKPVFEPPADCIFVSLTRTKSDLDRRIKIRIEEMFKDGFIAEVEHLSSEWKAFLLKKKLIGYPEVISFLQNPQKTKYDFEQLKELIATNTRAYAKRQNTFLRMLKKELINKEPSGNLLACVDIDMSCDSSRDASKDAAARLSPLIHSALL